MMEHCLESILVIYADLLNVSDNLADAMGLNSERVLAKVMPPDKETRRNTQRIKTWFEDNREAAEKRMEKEIKQRQREEVLAKLTPEERAILEG